MPDEHVDVFRNDWGAAVQERTVKVTDNGVSLSIVLCGERSPDGWVDTVSRLMAETEGQPFPERLAALTRRYDNSSYTGATDPHSDDDCPFTDTEWVPMTITRPPPARPVCEENNR